MSCQDLLVATIAQLVTIVIIIIIRREQLILLFQIQFLKRNFVTKTYSPAVNVYLSLALNYYSKS